MKVKPEFTGIVDKFELTLVERLKASKRVAALLRLLAVVVLVGWILIWLFASEDSRNRLTQEVKQTIGGFGRSDTAPGSAE